MFEGGNVGRSGRVADQADQADQARPLVGVVGDCWENKTVSGHRRGIERAHTHAVAQEGLTAGCST